MSFDELSDNVIGWAEDKGILERENAPKQMLKVLEEVGETAGSLLKSNEEGIKDGIGDSFVTLIILAKQLGLTPQECLEAAWNEIKDRKGKTQGGVFVKDEN
jgi:NTP pyrophosphatase (non-canonical NTP hydrolase)